MSRGLEMISFERLLISLGSARRLSSSSLEGSDDHTGSGSFGILSESERGALGDQGGDNPPRSAPRWAPGSS